MSGLKRERDRSGGNRNTSKQLEAPEDTGRRQQGRDRNNVQRQWGQKRSRERVRCTEGRKMMDGSRPLVTMKEGSQPSGQVNAKGRPGWSGTGTVPPRGYLSFPHLHYEFPCRDSPWLYTETLWDFTSFCRRQRCLLGALRWRRAPGRLELPTKVSVR